MTDKADRADMQNAVKDTSGDWAMSERRERAVMRELPDVYGKPRRIDDVAFKVPTTRGILSKAEIEALLRPNLPKINEAESAPEQVAPVEFGNDFQSPVAEPDEDTRRIAARLSLLFGHVAGLKTVIRAQSSSACDSIEVSLGTVGGPSSVYACFAPDEGDIAHVMVIPAAFAERLISFACGGRSGTQVTNRALSAIDCALLEQLIAPLSKAFAPDCRLTCIETDASYTASILARDHGQHRAFSVQSDNGSTSLDLFSLAGPRPASSGDRQKTPMTALLTARIATLSVPVSRLSQMKPGDTLLLGLPADQPVELLSGGRDGVPAFEGEIGRKGDRMAIRIRRARN
jgi:hypothetical protein